MTFPAFDLPLPLGTVVAIEHDIVWLILRWQSNHGLHIIHTQFPLKFLHAPRCRHELVRGVGDFTIAVAVEALAIQSSAPVL